MREPSRPSFAGLVLALAPAGLWPAGLALGGCVADPAAEPARALAPIVGGVEEPGFPLVGTLAADYGGSGIGPFCTASPVTPRVLITAAHCTDAFDEVGTSSIVYARLPPGGSGPIHRVVFNSRTTHPQWAMTEQGYVYDVAIVALQDPIDETMFPALHRSPSGGEVGTPLKVVGYGVDQPPDQGAGTRRSIDMSITANRGPYFEMVLADSWRGVCYGDSGGPSFHLGADRDTQYGVHARTQVDTCGPAEDTSVGYFYSSFVRSTVLAKDASAETCGDGVCTGLEDESSCTPDCAGYVCGDGLLEGPEVCDDGNTATGDGCAANCLSDERCGNSILDGAVGEICDDGNAAGGDGCSADCRSDETCGNAVLDDTLGELCDDGNHVDGDGCSADCQSDERCGNLMLDAVGGEVCDDGNTRGGDGCAADCRSDETCGNSIVDQNETCDDGNGLDGDTCPADCGHGGGLQGGCACRLAPRPAASGGAPGEARGLAAVVALAIALGGRRRRRAAIRERRAPRRA